MKHEDVRELFTSYYDGTLGDEEQRELMEHLESCSGCMAEWEEYKRTMEEVSGLLKVAPPEDTVRLVEKKIHKRSRGRFFSNQPRPSINYAVASFILVLFFMLAYLLLTAVNEIVLLENESIQDDVPLDTNSHRTD